MPTCAGVRRDGVRQDRDAAAPRVDRREEHGAPVFYLDGKGDRETAERFAALMADAGRSTRVFPKEPFDGGAASRTRSRAG